MFFVKHKKHKIDVKNAIDLDFETITNRMFNKCPCTGPWWADQLVSN